MIDLRQGEFTPYRFQTNFGHRKVLKKCFAPSFHFSGGELYVRLVPTFIFPSNVLQVRGRFYDFRVTSDLILCLTKGAYLSKKFPIEVYHFKKISRLSLFPSVHSIRTVRPRPTLALILSNQIAISTCSHPIAPASGVRFHCL
jgi:hypothetical protein